MAAGIIGDLRRTIPTNGQVQLAGDSKTTRVAEAEVEHSGYRKVTVSAGDVRPQPAVGADIDGTHEVQRVRVLLEHCPGCAEPTGSGQELHLPDNDVPRHLDGTRIQQDRDGDG